ncbi:galactokinase [Cellulomonas chengniuliangii]|uniref:galactokinase n=1 Tax=Cellulomonas chengniuliangii TaxID=2968084 RepID=UPI001D0E6DA6|nr:galactokinase [Cellulomonas chengniuliangii]MCC2319049.1 galactokinase [Cellulomonas chengniuliangii]
MSTTPTQVDAWSLPEGEARVRRGFAAQFGAGADPGVRSAPGRVNLIGEHTDYNGGLCLPIALPHRTFVALRPREDDLIRLASAQEPGDVRELRLADVAPGAVAGWTAYVAGVAWALAERGLPVRGFDAVVDSCVPYGAGLSSSAALEAAVAVALDDAFGLGLAGSPQEPDDAGRTVLAAACVRAENEIAGAPTGGMDQSASLRARAEHALLLDCLDSSVRHVPFDLAADGLALLVVDTRAAHSLVDGQYAARRATCEAAARTLGVASLREVTPGDGLAAALARLTEASEDPDTAVRRVRHVVSEIARVEALVELLDAGRAREAGPLLDASHASLRDDYEVSCVELDVAVESARAAGALGARMTGGGFGGSAIALVDVERVAQVEQAVAQAFAARGFAPPAFLVATAAGPAT